MVKNNPNPSEYTLAYGYSVMISPSFTGTVMVEVYSNSDASNDGIALDVYDGMVIMTKRSIESFNEEPIAFSAKCSGLLIRTSCTYLSEEDVMAYTFITKLNDITSPDNGYYGGDVCTIEEIL